MTRTIWFADPIEYKGLKTDSLVVDRLSESGSDYELTTDTGETLTVEKSNVARIE